MTSPVERPVPAISGSGQPCPRPDRVETSCAASGRRTARPSPWTSAWASVAASLAIACAAHGQCTSTASCFVVHGPGGCNSSECCQLVCGIDVFCCQLAWDASCVGTANEYCVANVVAGPIENAATHRIYYVLEGAVRSAAKATAESLGAHLVTISDAAEQAYVSSLVAAQGLPGPYFIGLNDYAVDGVFQWDGGTPVTYTNWAPGQPIAAPAMGAVSVNPPLNLWTSAAAFSIYPSVAEIELFSCGDPETGGCMTAHDLPYCDQAGCCAWVCSVDPSCCTFAWDTFCALVANQQCTSDLYTGPVVNPWTGRAMFLYEETSWPVASEIAPQLGLAMATVGNGQDNEFLRRFLVNSVPEFGVGDVWIGLTDRVVEGSFAWQSGEPLSFTRWAPGQPDNHADEDYVGLLAGNGAWADFNGAVAQRIVLERASPACPSDATCFAVHAGPGCGIEHCCHAVCSIDPHCCETVWDGACAQSALSICSPHVLLGPMIDPATKHAYYALSPSTWAEAQRQAMTMGGSLAVPNNVEEQTWLFVNFVQPSGGVSLPYIGIHDQLTEGAHQALDAFGTGLIGFSKWKAGAPNDPNGAQDAVVMGPGGLWDDRALTEIHPAIVEVPCVGDLNGSGVIDASDLAILLGAWGLHPGPSDLTFDGEVDAADLAILLGGWGPCDASSCCSVHAGGGCDQKGCTICVCSFDPFCCQVMWDANCTSAAANECSVACQCGG